MKKMKKEKKMKKIRNNKGHSVWTKMIAVMLTIISVFSLFSVIPVSALNFNGESLMNGGGHYAPTNTSGYSVPSDENAQIKGYRFAIVKENGDVFVDERYGVKTVDVYRKLSGEADGRTRYKVKNKMCKAEIVELYNNNDIGEIEFTTRTSGTYYAITSGTAGSGEIKFKTALPTPNNGDLAGPVNAWQALGENLLPIVQKIMGPNKLLSDLPIGSVITIEPIYGLKLEGKQCSMTATEIALYGAAVFGKDNNGGTSSTSGQWGFIADYTNRVYPNGLYTADSARLNGMWRVVTNVKNTRYDQYTFDTIIRYGYGVGIAYANMPTIKIVYRSKDTGSAISDAKSSTYYLGTWNSNSKCVKTRSNSSVYTTVFNPGDRKTLVNPNNFGLTRTGYSLIASSYKFYGQKVNVSTEHTYNYYLKIRNEKKPMFFSGAVEAAIKRKDINEAVYHLSKRPGEFARRLDQLLRIAEETNNEDKKIVLKAFKAYAKDVSVPVLLQVRQHFLTRKKNDIRVFYPKGSTAKVKYIKNNLPDISSSVCYEISKICENAICEQLRNKDSLGKVYIDPELQNYIVPFSQRSASSSTKTIVRGSRINIAESTNIIRSFIWWTNIENFRVDIDLSCSIYDDAWGYLSHISYTNLKSEKFNSYHSGDIVNGGSPTGKGAAEFIDIDINKVLTEGGRYVVFQVYSFSGYIFDKLKNCRFGWMERENADLGEIFEPSTVEMSMKLNSKSSSCVPVIFDCLERRYIWCDLPIESRDSNTRKSKSNNLENNLSKTTAICYSVVNTNKPDLFSLCRLNAFSRGVPVAKREEADVIFSLDTTVPMERVTEFDEKNNVFIEVEKPKQNVTIVTPFDIDYIMSNLL